MEPPQALLPDEIIRLQALREIVGGFAHEISQPLNAIMIATQVLKLGTDRSGMSQEERSFFLQRLDLVGSQIRKAGNTIELLRRFIKGQATSDDGSELKAVIETILSLMGQQLSGRGIRVVRDLGDAPQITRLDLQTAESLLVRSLAFARDRIESVGKKYESKSLPYDKVLEIRLHGAGEGPQIFMQWQDTFALDDEDKTDDIQTSLRVEADVISDSGGLIHFTKNGLVLHFPANFACT